MKILITGAAGNLGTCLARHLGCTQHELRLLVHNKQLPAELANRPNTSAVKGDLARPETLKAACQGIECVVHLAGVLFAPLPEKFLPTTNVLYVKNLLLAAQQAEVRKFILVSFPHAEGETTPDHPAKGCLDANPRVLHFRTRLQAERCVLELCQASDLNPVVFRAGIVYGREIRLFEAARWMLRHRLMVVWRRPTWAHLIALPDFLAALQRAIEGEQVSGIYQVCDDSPLTVQELLDRLADHYNCPHPWRLPAWIFHLAGITCETCALIFRTPAPLNRDIVRAGMTSCVADNARMKRELLPVLRYPTIEQGIELL